MRRVPHGLDPSCRTTAKWDRAQSILRSTGVRSPFLPTLQNAWHTTTTTIAWTVVYTVTLVGPVLFWGRLADRIGSQRIFGVV